VPRGRRAGWNLSAADAKAILQDLIHQGRVLAADISRSREIRKLEERLEALRGGARRGRRPGKRVAAAAAGGRRRRRSRITAQQLASRQLQGRYLGLIRQIPASQRGRYAKIAKDKGREAAIREMQGALK
jgi:O6-methylguanine-DNA--protein-cysteine methyltransferase